VFPDEPAKRVFVKTLLREVRSRDPARRSGIGGALTYVVLRRWMKSVDEPVLPTLKDKLQLKFYDTLPVAPGQTTP
jgi:hypothetical protein